MKIPERREPPNGKDGMTAAEAEHVLAAAVPLPAAFTTGTRPEHGLIAPVLTVALVWLAWHAVMFPAVAR